MLFYRQVIFMNYQLEMEKQIKSIKDEWPEIWLCDNLPDEYLIYEDGKFTPKEYKTL